MHTPILGFASMLGKTIDADAELVAELGCSAYSFDVGQRPKLDFSDNEWNTFRKLSEEGKKILLHMPYFLPVNTCIPQIFQGVYDYFSFVLEHFSHIPIHSVTFHTGYIEQILKADYSYLQKNLQQLSTLINGYGAMCNIENDDKNSDYPLRDGQIINEILDTVDSISLTYDIGHGYTGGIDHKAFIKRNKEKISVYHVHNNYGKDTHNSLDDGETDMKTLLPYIVQETPQAILILEHFPYEKIRYNYKLLLEYIS